MITEGEFSVKSLGECEPGELVHLVTHDRKVLAVVLADAADNRVHIGALDPIDKTARLTNFKTNADRVVLSYGRNWLLVPQRSGSVSWPGNNRALHDNGRLIISREGYFVRFLAPEHDAFGDDVAFNLSSSTIVDRGVGRDPVPLKGFAIWADQASFRRRDGKLFEFIIEDPA